ncbi:hypothetical protein V8C86DRAFT_118652 [Haematococcus lacustris]
MKSAVAALLLLALLCLAQGWVVAASKPPPAGNYAKSCGDCYWMGDTTYACKWCKKKDGYSMPAKLEWANRCNYVWNSNGMLTCYSCNNYNGMLTCYRRPRHALV